jgi:cell division protein FtsB
VKRRKRREKKYVFNFLVALIVLFLAFANIKAFLQNKKIKEQLDASVKKLEMLKTQKEKLEKELERGKKESFWEEKSREQGYQKEGEEPMIIKIK